MKKWRARLWCRWASVCWKCGKDTVDALWGEELAKQLNKCVCGHKEFRLKRARMIDVAK